MLGIIKIILAIILCMGFGFIALFVICASVLTTLVEEEKERDKK